jgi:hypothetical protein
VLEVLPLWLALSRISRFEAICFGGNFGDLTFCTFQWEEEDLFARNLATEGDTLRMLLDFELNVW